MSVYTYLGTCVNLNEWIVANLFFVIVWTLGIKIEISKVVMFIE